MQAISEIARAAGDIRDISGHLLDALEFIGGENSPATKAAAEIHALAGRLSVLASDAGRHARQEADAAGRPIRELARDMLLLALNNPTE